ncbi:hypothetical protein [Halalkalibacter hemicellulosilyticus]|nr:hypothetical protein [Halalkalibacter hemicellulosilyticus]
MVMKSLYLEMLMDFQKKLGRKLTNEEKSLLQWAEEKEYEEFYRRMKSS